MVQASLADVDTDVDSDDENDPALLSELNLIADDGEEEPVRLNEDSPQSPPPPQETFLPTSTVDVKSILQSRIQMYQAAESTAKAAGDSGKARRFGRGLKTLQDLLKQANAGKTVNPDDIPPEVSVKPAGAPAAAPEEVPSPGPQPSSPVVQPTRTAPPIPAKIQKQEPPSSPQSRALEALNARKEEYKVAAVSFKKTGDKENALKLVKILKLMDMAIAAVKEGQEIDLSEMPPPPEVCKFRNSPEFAIRENLLLFLFDYSD